MPAVPMHPMPTVPMQSVPVSVRVSVGPSLPAAAAASRAPAAVPGRNFISEPRHSLHTESQSLIRGEGEQSSAVQPHNITSHLDQNVSCAQRVVSEAEHLPLLVQLGRLCQPAASGAGAVAGGN